MTRNGGPGSGRGWQDDPARDVVEALFAELSEELGTDGPAETFGHPDESLVGRLIADDEGAHPDVTAEAVAHDSRDVVGLSPEEAALHYVDADDLDSDPDMTPAARERLSLYDPS